MGIYILTFLSGVLAWSLTEYLLHRFLGHVFIFKNKFRSEHQKHHFKVGHYTSTKEKILVAFVVLVMTFSFASLAIGFVLGTIFTAIFTAMYLIYESIHRRIHEKAPRNAFGRFIRKHHFYHHFDDQYQNHGVTSPIWDFVFLTYKKAEIVNIHKNFKMKWLCHLETQEIKNEYRKDYVIKESTRFT